MNENVSLQAKIIRFAHVFLLAALVLKGVQLVATLKEEFVYKHAYVSADIATAARSFVTSGLWALRFVPITDDPPLGIERAAYLHWPPLTPILLCLWYRIFGVSETATHGFSLAVAALMGIALYLLVRHTLGSVGAALAVLTWASLPVTLKYIHLPSQQNLAVTLSVFALFCGMKTLNGDPGKRNWRRAGLFATCLAVAASWEGALFAPGLLLAGALSRRRDVLRLGAIYTITSIGAVLAILALYFAMYPGLIAGTLHSALFRMGLATTYGAERIYTHGLAVKLSLPKMAALACVRLVTMLGVGAVAIAFMLVHVWRVRRSGSARSFEIAFIAATVAWVIWYVFFLNHVAIHAFEAMIAAPSAVLATAWCGLQVLEYVERRRLGTAFLACVFLVPALGFIPSAIDTYQALRGASPDDERAEVDFGKQIRRATPAGSVVLTPDGSMVPVFYSERQMIRYVSSIDRLTQILPLARANFSGAPMYFALRSDEERAFEPILRNTQILETRENGVIILSNLGLAPDK